jgi:hypothetical protein
MAGEALEVGDMADKRVPEREMPRRAAVPEHAPRRIDVTAIRISDVTKTSCSRTHGPYIALPVLPHVRQTARHPSAYVEPRQQPVSLMGSHVPPSPLRVPGAVA